MEEPKTSELNYQETPIIDPATGQVTKPVTTEDSSIIPEAAQIFSSQNEEVPEDTSKSPAESMSSKPPKKSIHLGTIIFVVLLFGLGVWLSIQFRSFFAPANPPGEPSPTSEPVTSQTPQDTSTKGSVAADSTWVSYSIVSGASKIQVSSLTFKLPGTVTAPVCDSANCPSQGTNLPGGTRFTVAARGKGQLLPDFRGAILTDATGKEFAMNQRAISGVTAYEYAGNFSGQTGGGFRFTQMRGILVPVTDTLSVEFNHFSPVGVTTDFAKDDELFNAIVSSLSSLSSPLESPTPTLASSETLVASGSGN